MNRIRLVDGYRDPERVQFAIKTDAHHRTDSPEEQEIRIEVYRALIEALDELLQQIREKESVSHARGRERILLQ